MNIRRLATVTLTLLVSVAALYSSVAPVAACSCAPVNEVEEVRLVMEHYGLVVEGAIAPRQEDATTDYIRLYPEILYVGDVSGEIVLTQTWAQAISVRGSGAYSYLGADCSYSLIGDPGDRYVLFLVAAENGRYAPTGCASFALGEIAAQPFGSGDWLQQRYDAIKFISGGGTIVEEAPPEDVPVSPDDSGGTVVEEAPPEDVPVSPEDSAGDGPASQPGDTPSHDEPTDHTESTPWAVVLPLAFAIPLAVLFVPAFLRRRAGH
ncbi:MAG: hypothetical protein IIC86_09630 [Chloroflexi bacterium]|nr:hypothetical protein [Chloroflexota bacterium]